MRDHKERKIGGDLAEEEPLQKKPTLIKPLPLRAQAKLPSGLGSAFKPWKKPSSNNGTDPAKPHDHKLDTSSNNHAPAENDNNEKNLENPNSNQPVEDQNPTNGSGAIATSGSSIDKNTAKAIEAQAIQPFLDSNTQIEMDRKLRKTISNRYAARRSRIKQIAHMEDLESKAEAYQEQIDLLRPQLEHQKRLMHSLQIEQHQLMLQMAAREKQRVLQELAIEKNRAEVVRLMEVLRKRATEAQARMHDVGASMQMVSNSKSDQALNGEGTSKRQVDHSLVTIKSEPKD